MFRDSVLLEGRALGTVYYRENRTEKYVSIPPAFIITDESGGTWTFGGEYGRIGTGRYERFVFSVTRNDVNLGELAERIEFMATRSNPRGTVIIYGPSYGRKVWDPRGWFV